MERIILLTILTVLTTFVVQNHGAPANSANYLVVTSSEMSRTKRSPKETVSSATTSTIPDIYQMHVKSNISNRFAHTTVASKVKNIAQEAHEATFSVVIPETAFISAFVMEVDGKNYTAFVKEKEEAQKTYDEAVASGLGAAHVAISARDSNRFTVSVNIEPETKAAFYLSYEELLKRDNSHYELVINLHPGQPVDDLSVEVVITESRKITDLKAPPLRSGNEIGSNNAELDPRANFEIINDTSAIVRFTPNLERQKQFAHLLGTKESEGLAGQFVVQYDVERDPTGGEVLIQDGYFVHFFAPSELAPIPKYVVFILDTSYSMEGQKLEQLKEAMHKVLEQLNNNDLFSLVEFATNVKVWDLNNANSSVWYPGNLPSRMGWHQPAEGNFSDFAFPNAYSVNADNIKNAKATISEFGANGGTDINTALKVGLHLVEMGNEQNKDNINRQPLIIFLTDGEPTVRETSTEKIINTISEYNSGIRTAPIFALSFGDGADKYFLQKLALRNSGFSKHIYESADASLQLQDFYRQIASPLLANVTFKYESSATSLTKTEYPIHFGGSEIVVSGFCNTPEIYAKINAWNGVKFISWEPSVRQSASSIERLWGYLTVKHLLEQKEVSENNMEELKKKALDISLKYSFVTPVSSLVVVKPNSTDAVDTEVAEKNSGVMDYSGSDLTLGDGLYYSDRNIMGTRRPPVYIRTTAANPWLLPQFPHPTPITTSKTSDIVKDLQWLSSILNGNGTITLPTGTYKLGENETISENIDCPKTPLNGTGHCTLLHSCPEVHSLLTNVDDFVNHFCEPQNGYAGICCPNQP